MGGSQVAAWVDGREREGAKWVGERDNDRDREREREPTVLCNEESDCER